MSGIRVSTLKTKIGKGVFWVTASTVLTRIVGIASAIILARILSPELYQ